MTRILRILSILCLLLPLMLSPLKEQKKEKNYGKTPDEYLPFGKFIKPYRRFFTIPLEFTGYGRDKAEPLGLKTVKIGFLGPIEPTVSVATGGASHEEALGRQMLKGAKMAIAEANDRGGYRKRKIPYHLVIKNDNGLWGSSGNEIVDLAYKDKVWAILGTIDGANSHIAIRVALKAEIPMMNSGDTDPTFSETKIPWAFRNITDDRLMCYLLADYVFKKKKMKRVAALRANNRYGRIGIDEFRDAARRLGSPFVTEINYNIGDKTFTKKLLKIKSMNPDAVISFGNAIESGLILKEMRRLGMNQLFIGSDRIISSDFIKKAGKNPGYVIAASPYNPSDRHPKALTFKKNFRKRWGNEADAYAAHAYDGIQMLIKAIERGGLNRYRIRDELAAMKHYHGVTGKKQFNHVYSNISDPYLAVLKKGRWTFIRKTDLFK